MNVTWFLIRGSGIAAFVLLTASVAWGLMVSTKLFGRAVKAKGLQWIHESLGIAAVVATVLHLGALWADEFIEFTVVDLLVPGASEWEPMATALGIVAFWTLLVVTFSFYVKKWIGQGAWRTIHYLAFGSYTAALVHGVAAGTDTANPWMAGMYIGSAILVGLLTVVRILLARAPAARTAPTRA